MAVTALSTHERAGLAAMVDLGLGVARVGLVALGAVGAVAVCSGVLPAVICGVLVVASASVLHLIVVQVTAERQKIPS